MMGYARRRVGEDVGRVSGEAVEWWPVEGAERRSRDEAGRGVRGPGTEAASEGWGLKKDEGWTPLVVRERTNESDSGESLGDAASSDESGGAASDSGEFTDPAESPPAPPSAPDVFLGDLSDLMGLPEDDAIDELGDRIIKLSAHMSAAEHRLLLMIGEFDRREGWKPAGHKDCAAWLEMNTGLNRVTARERVRVARALHELPETSEAMAKGELTFSKVRGLTRVATPENEVELLPLARECTAHQLERELQRWRELEQWGDEEAERRRYQRRRLSVRPGGGGMYEVRGLVSPDVGALLMRVIDAAGDALFLRDWAWSAEGGRWGPAVKKVKPQQRRADALRLILERAMEAGFELPGGCGAPECEVREGGGESAAPRGSASAEAVSQPAPALRTTPDEGSEVCPSESVPAETPTPPTDTDPPAKPCTCSRTLPSASAERYLVLFNVDQKTLEGEKGGRAELDGQATVSLETARRITCDSAVVRIVRGARSEILDVGRKTRTLPPAIRRALWARDGGCRFPGCGSQYAYSHHVEHWASGGKTSLDNLVLLCHPHHKGVHEGGFEVKIGRFGKPYFLDLNGCRIPDQAPPMAVPASVADDPVRDMVETHRCRGIEPTNTTGSCRKVISPEKMDRFWEGLDPPE